LTHYHNLLFSFKIPKLFLLKVDYHLSYINPYNHLLLSKRENFSAIFYLFFPTIKRIYLSFFTPEVSTTFILFIWTTSLLLRENPYFL